MDTPITLTPEQLDLLKTYRTGRPVIWDAAWLAKIVFELLHLGLIAPDPDSIRGLSCIITDKGRQVLALEVSA